MEKAGSLLSGLDAFDLVLSKAKGADYNSIQELLLVLSNYIERGDPIPAELREWICLGLRDLARGGDEKSAFGLRKPRGARPAHSEEFERLVADSIHFSGLGRHKSINKNGSSQGAYSEAASDFDISETTAEKFYKKYRDTIISEEEIRREFDAEDQSRE